MSDDLGFAVTCQIGPSLPGLEDVRVQPMVEFKITSVSRDFLCGQHLKVGDPVSVWRYPDMLLSGVQYYQLKSLVGDKLSANVVIQTPTQNMNLTTYAPQLVTYSAVMVWPEKDVMVVSQNRWGFPGDGISFINLTDGAVVP